MPSRAVSNVNILHPHHPPTTTNRSQRKTAAAFLCGALFALIGLVLLSEDAHRTSDMQQDAYDQELRAIRSSRHGLRLTAAGQSAGSVCRQVCKSPITRGCAMCRIQHKMMLGGNLVDAYGVVTPLPGGGEGVSGSYEESQDTPGCVLAGDTTRDERRIDCVRDPE